MLREVILKFEDLLVENLDYFKKTDENILEFKPDNKWSKKEILGHLIDSAIHNLVRFTEIHYSPKPYQYRTYNQEDLVNIGQYQSTDSKELIQLWLSLNRQILRIFKSVDSDALHYEIELNDKSIINLRFLMSDYVAHLEHHIKQIQNRYSS
ncbi:DinB family protein [Flavobacterium microcysteis]